MKFAALLLLVVAGCVTPTPVASRSSAAPNGSASAPRTQPTATAAAGSYAVVVSNFLEGQTTYNVSLLAADGHVAGSASPRKRSHFVQIGNVSTSLTTLYYLDGDTDIHYLKPDGTTGLATTVTLRANQVAAFAVSPDDRRIAVSVLDYTRYPVGTRLYVEDLNGHANHVELFASTTALEWPAGWHNGRLVMALGLNVPPQNLYEGFARGHGYHVADAQTGNRLLSLCDGGDTYEAESPAGFACVQYPRVAVVTWDGQTSPAPVDGGCAIYGPLSPAGVMASNLASTNGGCGAGPDVFLVGSGGNRDARRWTVAGRPSGWLDADHFVAVADQPYAATPIWIGDTVTGAVTKAAVTGFFAAALPGAL